MILPGKWPNRKVKSQHTPQSQCLTPNYCPGKDNAEVGHQSEDGLRNRQGVAWITWLHVASWKHQLNFLTLNRFGSHCFSQMIGLLKRPISDCGEFRNLSRFYHSGVLGLYSRFFHWPCFPRRVCLSFIVPLLMEANPLCSCLQRGKIFLSFAWLWTWTPNPCDVSRSTPTERVSAPCPPSFLKM